jgi:hypothetical protein
MNDPYNAADLGLSLEDVLEYFDNAIDYTLLNDNNTLTKEELDNIELPF